MNTLGAPTNPQETGGQELTGAAKAIRDLEVLVQALFTTLPASRPWQRQLRVHLAEADRLGQVLRLLVAMDRGDREISQAADDLAATMRIANTHVNGGRADMGTKTAVFLGFNLAQKIAVSLAKQRD